MAITATSQAFLDWLDETVGERWFNYCRTDLTKGIYMIVTLDERDGYSLWYVWHRGRAIAYESEVTATKKFNQLKEE